MTTTIIFSPGPPVEVPLVWSPGYSSVPVVGQPFGLTCPLEGNPPLTYTWERYPTIDRQSPPLPLPPTLTFGEGGHSWEVDSFSAQENGFYVCKGSNALGNHSYVNVRHFYLNADSRSHPLYTHTHTRAHTHTHTNTHIHTHIHTHTHTQTHTYTHTYTHTHRHTHTPISAAVASMNCIPAIDGVYKSVRHVCMYSL